MFFLQLAALIALLLTSHDARAMSADKTRHVRVAFLAEKRAVAPGDTVTVAMSMDIIPEWHTYWRNPGDSGIAPTISWTLPPGFSAGPIQWAAPSRMDYGPLVNFGYSTHVNFLTDIKVPETAAIGTTAPLSANFNWLVCQEECIPEGAKLSIDIPIAAASVENSETAQLFSDARTALPEPAAFPIKLDVTPTKLILEVGGESAEDAAFFPYKGGLIDNSAPQLLTQTSRGFELSMLKGELKTPITALDGVIELFSSPVSMRAFTVSVDTPASATTTKSSSVQSDFSLPFGVDLPVTIYSAALLALLGGVILNLMPCVFPVLSLKALGIVNHAHGSRREAAMGGLAYTLGILAAFAAVAGVLLMVKQAGGAVGWGFQLQSPGFVMCLAYLLFIMGLSLSGFFEFGGRLVGAGSALAAQSGLAGSFFTGILAALVATPCSAPFMGTALGFAVVQPWPVAVAIVECLGLGLAMPLLLCTLIPALARCLPRPGVWMERFKQILAFPLYGSAVWLVWVLSLESGPQGVLIALAGAVLVTFAIWLLKTAPTLGDGWRFLCRALAVLLVLATLAGPTLPSLSVTREENQNSFIPDGWEPFSAERLEDLRKAGTPVFVDMSAAWCLTCILNEKVALGPKNTAILKKQKIVLLKGDWTNRDSQITAFLNGFGRDGVPIYVFYPGGDKMPVVLPQILTPDLVLSRVRAEPPAPEE
jgi:thiol:disulfide interchange protein DsbD